ncbi:hypothetical protein [Achromobacter xylosoxidans]|uniref:hypothetical protein n=1 Tax=Alcaligenes xylosoxydans xylosoxydans TaxID=85698 RepID=UPI001EEB4965|nr:hypothetical protein [Achromobacter xylosoxidans]
MRERPVLFNGAMVQAMLAGTKTLTRRVVKPWVPALGVDAVPADISYLPDFTCYRAACPYGQPGDHLWVREAWRSTADLDKHSGSQIADLCLDAGYNVPWAPIQYEADGARRDWRHTSTPPHDGPPQPGRYRHGRFMPRWACRLVLEITGVRVERLQDISEADAQGEGCAPAWLDADDNQTVHAHRQPTYRQGFARLWREINGPSSWDANPWVWVVEFRRLPPGGLR